MTRKLHNTLMALVASSSLLTLSLIAGTPVMPSLHDTVTPAALANLDQTPALPEASIGDGQPASMSSPVQTKVLRGKRQSVSMPFFSFVPRG